jgi:hypothetical protein
MTGLNGSDDDEAIDEAPEFDSTFDFDKQTSLNTFKPQECEEPELDFLKDRKLSNGKRISDLAIAKGGNDLDLRKPISIEKGKT